MLSYLLLLLIINTTYGYPIIMIHGIASDKTELNSMYNYLIEKHYEVYNIEIGNGKLDSIFMNMNKQCLIFSEYINKLNLEGKINILGISQGGLIARCYVEKYSHLINSVNSLITIGTPHMGIFNKEINISSLEYWKNPYQYNEYLEFNDFLVYINNDKYHDNYDKYKLNIESINNFILVWSEIDEVIVPLESSQFEFYNITEAEINNKLLIEPLLKSSIYYNLGLNKVNIKLIKYNCKHDKFKTRDCYENYLEDIFIYL